MVVRHRAQGPTRAGVLEECRQHRHQGGGDQGRKQVFLAHQDAAREGAFKQEDRILGHADVDLVDV